MARLRPGSEDGIALVMAVLVLAVLTVTTVSVISFTSATSRDASLSKAGQQAYSLAEAGFNNALAQIASHYPAGIVHDPSWVIGGTKSYAGGTATWSATFVANGKYRGTWKVTATGSVANPTGPDASSRERTISADLPVWEQPGSTGTPEVWNYVYSGGQSCTTISQTVTFSAPLYTPGNVCLANQGSIVGATEIAIGGNLTIARQGSVGTPLDRVDRLHLVGSCTYWNNGPWGPPCPDSPPTLPALTPPQMVNSLNGNIWADYYDQVMPLASDGSPITAPVINWDVDEYGVYHRASPGPKEGCSVSSGTPPTFESAGSMTMDKSVPGIFNLTPVGSSYTCRARNGGEISWDGSARLLTVNGTIFIDGSIEVDTANNPARYVGSANVYVSGTVKLRNNSTLCAKLSGSSCDFASWSPGGADGILTFIANGDGDGQVSAGRSIEVYQSTFQGGLYGTKAIQVEQGSTVQGPMISPDVIMPRNSSAIDFPGFINVQIGLPGDDTPPTFMLGPPENETY